MFYVHKGATATAAIAVHIKQMPSDITKLQWPFTNQYSSSECWSGGIINTLQELQMIVPAPEHQPVMDVMS